jgi:hypothetical protein
MTDAHSSTRWQEVQLLPLVLTRRPGVTFSSGMEVGRASPTPWNAALAVREIQTVQTSLSWPCSARMHTTLLLLCQSRQAAGWFLGFRV